jgi:hypothetical protein
MHTLHTVYTRTLYKCRIANVDSVRPLAAVQLVLYRANGSDVAMELTAPNVTVRDAWVAGLGEAIGRYVPL